MASVSTAKMEAVGGEALFCASKARVQMKDCLGGKMFFFFSGWNDACRRQNDATSCREKELCPIFVCLDWGRVSVEAVTVSSSILSGVPGVAVCPQHSRQAAFARPAGGLLDLQIFCLRRRHAHDAPLLVRFHVRTFQAEERMARAQTRAGLITKTFKGEVRGGNSLSRGLGCAVFFFAFPVVRRGNSLCGVWGVFFFKC